MIIYDHVLCPFIVLFNFEKDARESVNCDIFRRFIRSGYVCIFFNWFSWSNVHSARACISTDSMEKLVYCIWVENTFWIQCQTLFAILVLADFNFGSRNKRDPIQLSRKSVEMHIHISTYGILDIPSNLLIPNQMRDRNRLRNIEQHSNKNTTSWIKRERKIYLSSKVTTKATDK